MTPVKISIKRLYRTIARRACSSDSAYLRMISGVAFGILICCRSRTRNDGIGHAPLEPYFACPAGKMYQLSLAEHVFAMAKASPVGTETSKRRHRCSWGGRRRAGGPCRSSPGGELDEVLALLVPVEKDALDDSRSNSCQCRGFPLGQLSLSSLSYAEPALVGRRALDASGDRFACLRLSRLENDLKDALPTHA